MDLYNIDALIKYALRSGVDISPIDRKDWVMFCCALKVLGYDETTFVALSSGAEKDSRQVWRAERHPQRYKTEESAKGMIVELAKQAGVNVKNFLLSPNKKKTANRETHHRPTAPTTTPPEKTTAAPTFVSMDAVKAAAAQVDKTALFAFLSKEFGEAEARRVCSLYLVGASKYTAPNGFHASAFPYINTAQRIVDCKLFHINPTTGSRKTAAPLCQWVKNGEPQKLPTSWVLSEMNRERRKNNLPEYFRADWCNFGDHLLQLYPTAEVCLVESEKTALIAAITYPEKLWIAVGSKYNLTAERCAVYAGRKVWLFPDRDGYKDKVKADGSTDKGWETIAEDLAACGLGEVWIDTTTERHHGEANDDLADIILRYRHGTQELPPPPPTQVSPQKAEAANLLAQFEAKNPNITKLVKFFNLEPISVEPPALIV